MTDVRLTLDREPRVAPQGSTVADLVALYGPADAVAVRVDEADGLSDLATVVADGARLESVPAASEEGRAVLRHSTAHVMAQAVTELYPGVRIGIGPPVTDGFYYDFDVPEPFTPDDVRRIEARMRQIVKAGQSFRRRALDADEARRLFADQPYKLELVDRAVAGDTSGEEALDAAGPELTVYDNVDRPRRGEEVGEPSVAWTDLCRGPHVPTTRALPAFKLLRTAAAYWRGDERNPQLQRVYGTAWESREALDSHLERLAEAERRDHRRLGAELDLFSFPDEIGSGLPVFHPRGGTVRRVMEDFSRARHEAAGYSFVTTPHITKGQLFETSGHLQWYAEGMYPPMVTDAGDYYLKPMNCPLHNLVYSSRGRSYRELPLRLFEFGGVYRYEKSGVVHGLTRVRGFTMDDAHIYCTREQAPAELGALLGFVLQMLRDFGLEDFYLELSTRDDSPKFVGEQADWDEATAALQSVADASGLALVPDPGGAAFYGPKISVQARDALGRSWQMSTIQVDFQLPERFDLVYTAPDGSRQRPVMIHRALFGSVERFVGILLEHYAGALPPWLAPVTVVGVPVNDEATPHLRDVADLLRAAGVRVEVDASDDRMQKKIRTHTKQKVPFLLIAGPDDVAAGAVSFRYRDGTQDNGVPVPEAVERIAAAVRDRVQVD